jgi:predicted RNA binding protein YcfA (HicA-like mRNA interferase family)
VSNWPAVRAGAVLRALHRIGCVFKRQPGSHGILSRPDSLDYVFAFRGGGEIGPRMLARIAKLTGLRPSDL